MPFKYWTYGAAATEVELDVLTGTHRVIRADIVMDLGQPLNPALDIGQIEGAYVQASTLHFEIMWYLSMRFAGTLVVLVDVKLPCVTCARAGCCEMNQSHGCNSVCCADCEGRILRDLQS